MRRLAALPAAAVRRKLGDFLQRRGFAYDVVRSVVTECLTEQGAPPDDLQSED
jgi:SOS response regulatory protein OraA/RecX